MKHGIFFILLWLAMSTVAVAQHKIISLAPSLTQNLYLLNLEDEVVGYTSYCEIAVKSKKPIVASAVKVNLEKVVSLQPDLIVSTTITNPETIQQLKNFGIRVEVFPTPSSFNEICEQFLEMGKMVEKEDLAKEIVSSAKLHVDSLQQVMKKLPVQRMFFQVGANPLYAVPPGTFMNDYMRFANGENICDTPESGSISRESVVIRNPEIIFLTAMGIVGSEEQKIWESYPEVSAIKKQQIFMLDPNKSCSPTPATFVETLDTIAHLLMPQIN